MLEDEKPICVFIKTTIKVMIMMDITSYLNGRAFVKKALLTSSCVAATLAFSGIDAFAQQQAKTPSLIISSGPLPEALQEKVYTKPVQVREITAQEVISGVYPDDGSSAVAGRIAELNTELSRIQSRATSLAGELAAVQRENEAQTADYYAGIATINTQLQSGTTPGNPRLVAKLREAEQYVETLGARITELNALSNNISEAATQANFLVESAQSAFKLSGAFEEDHIRLAELEDSATGTLVLIERMLDTVNEDIMRNSAYLATERENLRMLAIGVEKGDLYGKSLAKSGGGFQQASYSPAPSSATAPSSQSVNGQRILAKIKFDRPDVNYEQPVYMAVNQALERYPNARFDLVAVNPTGGNAAEVAIETTRARRNAEKVLRSLSQMGLPEDKVDLSYRGSDTAQSSEVHLFIK